MIVFVFIDQLMFFFFLGYVSIFLSFSSADIVASFRLQRTVAELKENISRLEYDIYVEVGSPGTIVCFNSLLSFFFTFIPAQ
jgi:hypothetical protein